MPKSQSIDRSLVLVTGGQIMSGQLAGHRDPASVAGDHLDRLADLSVRAALALDAAIPRAEERLAAEAQAAEDAAAAKAEKDKADAAAEKAAVKEAAAEQKASDKADAASDRAAPKK